MSKRSPIGINVLNLLAKRKNQLTKWMKEEGNERREGNEKKIAIKKSSTFLDGTEKGATL